MVSEIAKERRMKWDRLMDACSRKRELSINSYALNVFLILIASEFVNDVGAAFHSSTFVGLTYLLFGLMFSCVYVFHFVEMFKLREEM